MEMEAKLLKAHQKKLRKRQCIENVSDGSRQEVFQDAGEGLGVLQDPVD